MATKTYRVKQVARLCGATVRTLHHYDAIGLLSPQGRSRSGHRLYSEADLLRLQQILVYRELDLPLEKIKGIVTDPSFDLRAALLEQRATLAARAAQTEAMIRAIDVALRAHEGESTMNAEELFDGFDPSKYEAEAEERWGDTEAYRESRRRTKDYSKEDWVRIKGLDDALMKKVAAAVAAGAAPSDEASMDLAEAHREHIERFYYPCSHAMHRSVAQMYTADARFQKNLDAHGEGVAAFLQAAIEANAQRA